MPNDTIHPEQPPACLACGYNLTGLGNQPVCPECGANNERNPPYIDPGDPVVFKLFMAIVVAAAASVLVEVTARAIGTDATPARRVVIIVFSTVIVLWYFRGSLVMVTADPAELLYTYRRGSTNRIPWSEVWAVDINPDSGIVVVRRKGWRAGLRLTAGRSGGKPVTLAWGETAARYWRFASGNQSQSMFEPR